MVNDTLARLGTLAYSLLIVGAILSVIGALFPVDAGLVALVLGIPTLIGGFVVLGLMLSTRAIVGAVWKVEEP